MCLLHALHVLAHTSAPVRAIGTSARGGATPEILADQFTLFQSGGEADCAPSYFQTFLRLCVDYALLSALARSAQKYPVQIC